MKSIVGPPKDADWEQAKVFVRFLKTFYDMTLKISGSLYVTANTFFQEICEIHGELKELAKEPNSLMGTMAASMKKKYNKYWGNPEKIDPLLFIATVLDPRCKLELLKVGFELTYDAPIVNMLLKNVDDTLHKLYDCYKEMMDPLLAPSKNDTQSSSSSASKPPLGTSKPVPSIFKAARLVREAQAEKNDLLDYLNDHCEDLTDESFDILLWWKLNASRYKIVSQIAKDVLASQISTVASESAFSTSGRILNSFRSSLSAKMVEAVICSKNWLQSSKEPIVLREYLDEVEALDDSEKAIEDNESCVTTEDVRPIDID